jgi:hypothetical protein
MTGLMKHGSGIGGCAAKLTRESGKIETKI